MSDQHYHLQFKFTNRGGADVYEIFDADDNKRLAHPLGTLAVAPTDFTGHAPAGIIWAKERDEFEADAAEQKAEQLELDLGGDA